MMKKHKQLWKEFSKNIIFFFYCIFLAAFQSWLILFAFIISTVNLVLSVDLFIVSDVHYTCCFKISFRKERGHMSSLARLTLFYYQVQNEFIRTRQHKPKVYCTINMLPPLRLNLKKYYFGDLFNQFKQSKPY